MTLLRSSALVSWRSVACAPSRICSTVPSLIASPASRLSATGSRLSAKLSTANLRALLTSSSARRRPFSRSALARRNWSAKSAFLACKTASSAWAWAKGSSQNSGSVPSAWGSWGGVGWGVSLIVGSGTDGNQSSKWRRCPGFSSPERQKCSKRHGGPAAQRTPSSSTSNFRVALGGITPPAPRAP